MAEASSVLTPEIAAVVQELGKADILVGIPSYNNANTIGQVVRAVSAGLSKNFSQSRAVLVNSDGGSSDGTPDIVEQSLLDGRVMLISDRQSLLHKIMTPYHGIPGKSNALRSIFEIGRRLHVKACAIVDSDLRNITPEWIELLLRPVLDDGYDYVAPYYLRHKYDGTMTNSMIYPLTRCLYGQRIRQPLGGDCGFSGGLGAHYLKTHVWESDVATFGIDIWMTMEALASGARVCQSFLGAKSNYPKDSSTDVSALLVHVMGAFFASLEEHQAVWKKVQGSNAVRLFGFHYDVGVEPVHVNTDGMVASFRRGLTDLEPIWRQMLAPETIRRLTPLKQCPLEAFKIPDDLWAQLLFDVAVAHHRRVLTREHLLKALTPLYLGQTASFVLETEDLTSAETEGRLETLCQTFEQRKSYLIDRWRRR